jgi:hypothetical protein
MNKRLLYVFSAVLAILAPFTYMQCDAVQARQNPHQVDAKIGTDETTAGQTPIGSADRRFVMKAVDARCQK